MDRVYGLIFDVDGVIADTEGVNARASISMFDEMFGLKGVLRGDFEKGLGRGAAAYVRAAAEVHGFGMTDEQVERATEVRQAKFLEILEKEPLGAFEGVVELMGEAMRREDFRVAIATSSTRAKSEAVLRSAQIPYEQMTYITGSDVTRKKPDPELFAVAANRAGVKTGDSVVIEDAPDGVAAAKAAGCRCVAVTNSTTAERLSGADMIVQSLAEVNIEAIRWLIEG